MAKPTAEPCAAVLAGEPTAAKNEKAAKPTNAGLTIVKKFGLSGVSGMIASAITNPIEVMKVRMQLQGELAAGAKNKGLIRLTGTVLKTEGLSGLFKGLSASLIREATYTGTRLTLYEPMKKLVAGGAETHGLQMSLSRKVLAASLAGMSSAVLCNPIELLKTRMQAAEARVYRHTGDCMMRILRTEGLLGMWRGVSASIMRSAIVGPSQIATYDHTKHLLIGSGYFAEGLYSHALASFVASLVATTTVNPFDTIRTRYMTARQNYSGLGDCFIRTMRAEGMRGFYKGWVPQYLRIGPRTFLVFMILEQLRKLAGIRQI